MGLVVWLKLTSCKLIAMITKIHSARFSAVLNPAFWASIPMSTSKIACAPAFIWNCNKHFLVTTFSWIRRSALLDMGSGLYTASNLRRFTMYFQYIKYIQRWKEGGKERGGGRREESKEVGGTKILWVNLEQFFRYRRFEEVLKFHHQVLEWFSVKANIASLLSDLREREHWVIWLLCKSFSYFSPSKLVE